MSTETIKSYLNHVEIRGFRSLKDVSVELSPLTVLIGANGAGKSNFIKFFELMRWLMEGSSLKEWVSREGGADDNLFMGSRETEKLSWKTSSNVINPNINTGGENRYQYEATLIADSADRMAFASEAFRHIALDKIHSADNWVTMSSHPDHAQLTVTVQNKDLKAIHRVTASVLLHSLNQCRSYQFHDTSKHANIKKAHDTSDSIFLNSDGGNLAAVLLGLLWNNTKRLQLIERQIKRVLPVFDGFVLETQHGKVMLRWRHKQSDKVMGAHLTSDGSLRLFCLITLLNLPTEQLPDVILLDEPELGLHPNAITLIAAMIQRVSLSSQVILATQSPFMVDCFDLENITVADVEDGATRLRKLERKAYQQWLDDEFSLSELWLSNVLGGQP